MGMRDRVQHPGPRDGKRLGGHHHHAIISRPEGLEREAIEDLWGKGRARCERLDFEHGSVEGAGPLHNQEQTL